MPKVGEELQTQIDKVDLKNNILQELELEGTRSKIIEKIRISLHGQPFCGKQTFVDCLEKQKIIKIISTQNKNIISKGVKESLEGPLRIPSEITESFGRIIDFQLCEKYAQLFPESINFQIKIVSGTVFHIDKVLEFLFKKCSGLLLLFDITDTGKNKNYFHSSEWEIFLKKLSHNIKGGIDEFPLVICFNKSDMQLTLPKFYYNTNHHYPQFITSAVEGKNIEIAFLKLLKLISAKFTS